MDPIHLGRARMTKTPLPSLADEEWEALTTKELGRGEELFFFLIFFLMTHEKPCPWPQWAFPQKPTIVG